MTDKEHNFAKDINVPHKKQIMIDGVNVSECDFSLDCIGIICQLKNGRTDKCNCSDYPNCYYKQLARKTQECEELKRKLSNQEQLYQNEIEIYNKSCLQLRQENDDLYLERLALNTANSGINALLEVKEQENDRYRNALEEIEEYCNEQNLKYDTTACEILDIINKAKGEKKCQ